MKEEFKLVLSRFWLIFLILIGIPLLSYGIWVLMPKKNLEILIVNKTVPNYSYREHAGLFWTLNHEKYQNASGNFYDKAKDYLGFFPSGNSDFGSVKDWQGKSEVEIKKQVEGLDLVFLADTYGVYESDFEKSEDFRPEKKIYGGLDASDISLIKNAKDQGKTLVAEFNAMATPTSKTKRTEFENLLGIKWTGWVGRYFDELDTAINTDTPSWLVTQYQDQKGSWDFSGPGLVFVKESGEIEVFSYGEDFQNAIPLIRSPRINKHGFELPQVIPYPDWFDVVMIERDYQVVSYYDINPTNEGVKRLRSMGLPRFFPATVFREVNEGRQYYFAGDFSDMENRLGSPKFAGLPFLWRGLYVVADHTNRQGFFWNYYLPLMTQILDEVYEKKQN